ncbi:hypothetical protein [Phaeovulum sp.]|uniref:hypothetical protein n=1 Tax=Phaeovulum sp. TaxID=2934796 RepID=UPI0035662C26
MFGLRRKPTETEHAAPRPVLDLSGPRLRRAFDDLVQASEPTGGLERYVTALALKASLFDELLGDGQAADLTEAEFLDLAAFITPVRRRISAHLAQFGFEPLRLRLAELVHELDLTDRTDARMAAFDAGFSADSAHRWVRDLGAEVLHFTRPADYPLMTRWVWDAGTGTGVLREIWASEDVDAAKIVATNEAATFQTLRDELDGFLADEGVFRDRHFYVDLLMSHVYAGYINDRGGQYLRTDFTLEGDPMQHTRRMLGLDAVNTETGRTRLRLIDGTVHRFGGLPAPISKESADAHS